MLTPRRTKPFIARFLTARCLALLALLGTLLPLAAGSDAGPRGRGVKVLVVDSGFRGYRSFLGKDLPADVTARSFRKDGNLEARDSQHGILCAEVIHSIAPEAKLLFANWEPHQPASFLEAIRWGREQGAKVVSCSCIMPNWSDGEGGGAVHEEFARILGDGKKANDLLFFGCAGNTAHRHWHGAFQPDAQGWHQWARGETENPLAPWGDDEVSVELYCRPGATFELSVIDKSDATVVTRAASKAEGDRCTAVARFKPRVDRQYSARLRVTQGKPEAFHVVSLHSDMQTASRNGSICFPGDGRYVVAVGAVDASGERCSYSACGPNSALPKPDLVASVPFLSRLRARPFAGTSAATPKAAGTAALLWSSRPESTADAVRTALLKSARDVSAPGHDWQTGYGVVTLPAR